MLTPDLAAEIREYFLSCPAPKDQGQPPRQSHPQSKQTLQSQLNSDGEAKDLDSSNFSDLEPSVTSHGENQAA